MTVFAIPLGPAIVSWIGLALGLVILLAVLALFNRVIQPALEIKRYADDILDGGLGIARNVDGVDELERTRQLGGAVPGLAGDYLARLERGQS